MLKKDIEHRKDEIMKSLGFKYNPRSGNWALKVNHSVLISDWSLERCHTKEEFRDLLVSQIEDDKEVRAKYFKKKRLLAKLLATTVY